MRKFHMFAAILCLLVVSGTAHAEHVTWSFEGEVTLLTGTGFGTTALGDRFTGSITFEAATAFGPELSVTKTDLLSSEFTPWPYMDEVSTWRQAQAVGDPSILDISVAIASVGGPVLLDAPTGPDAVSLLRHRINEYVSITDGPPGNPFDTFFTFVDDSFTTIGTRLISQDSPSGLFPLSGLLTEPPSLMDLHLGRFFASADADGDGFVDSQIFGVFDKLVNGILVSIDISPGTGPSCVNINGHGVIPVVVLGGDTFDVTQVDQLSLSFGGLEVRVRGNKGPLCGFEYVNGDAFLDLVCHFEDDASNWNVGEGDASLTGSMLDGTEFGGTDSICVVP